MRGGVALYSVWETRRVRLFSLISLISLLAQSFSRMKAPARGLISLFSHKVHYFSRKRRHRTIRRNPGTVTWFRGEPGRCGTDEIAPICAVFLFIGVVSSVPHLLPQRKEKGDRYHGRRISVDASHLRPGLWTIPAPASARGLVQT
jgi:hypothetical protein